MIALHVFAAPPWHEPVNAGFTETPKLAASCSLSRGPSVRWSSRGETSQASASPADAVTRLFAFRVLRKPG